MAAGLDPKTGIYTYADGSTYQNPFQYAPGVWSLNDAQNTAMLGDQGAAVNAQLGRTAQAATPWNDPVQPVWGGLKRRHGTSRWRDHREQQADAGS